MQVLQISYGGAHKYTIHNLIMHNMLVHITLHIYSNKHAANATIDVSIFKNNSWYFF